MAKLLINPAAGGNSDYYGTFINTTNFFTGNVFKGLNVTQTASASMAVVVNPGSGLIREGTFPGQIGYHVAIDTVGGETVTIATANVSNPRIDAIVGYIDKSVTVPSGTNNTNIYKLAAVAGTPGVSPVAPTDAQIKAAIGAANPYDTYATVLVGTSVSQVATSNITDRRNTAIGGIAASIPDYSIPVTSLASARDVLYNSTDTSTFSVATPGSFVTFGPNLTFTTPRDKTEVEIKVFLPKVTVGGTLQADWRLYDSTGSVEILSTTSTTTNIGSGAWFPNGIRLETTYQYAVAGTYTINVQQNASGVNNPSYQSRKLYQVKLNRFYS
ncbi:hypothetical protein [Rhodococcus sp. YH3-3]|uniref:hypothetical protein n=1 Tax=Rhodococcus sp. YH3-3 TaxID=1803579 RepID=UPI000B1E224B|nr:hypothetical protein [Rhodococcus sp. YH3-3]